MPHRLVDLADVLRSAGQTVDETAVPDWRDRSRTGNTSWYVDGRPTHVMVHHTASPPGSHDTLADERQEAYRCGVTHAVRPVSNVYRGPSGTWYPIAAGPSNTNGTGIDWWGGGVPVDAMNSYAVAIEVGNDGVGEPWTDLPGLVAGVAALCRAWGIPAHNVRGHFEWAPNRKIDPASGATATPYSPRERYGKFDMDAFRADVDAALNPSPAPETPDEEDDDMADKAVAVKAAGADASFAMPATGPLTWIRSAREFNRLRDTGLLICRSQDGLSFDDYTVAELQAAIGSRGLTGGDTPPGYKR